MRIYLDLCALKRPFDVASSDQVVVEALAVVALIAEGAEGKLTIVGSAILETENSRNPNPVRRERVASYLTSLKERVELDAGVESRGRELGEKGLHALDALHAASAEAGACQYLVTTDRRMLRALRRAEPALPVKTVDPLEMLGELREQEL